MSLLKSPDAKRVVEHKPHVLDQHHIDVSWVDEEESGPTEDAVNVVDRESAARIPEPERTLTFSVSGFSPRTTEDTVRHYFENVRRSGGGEITELNYSTEDCVAEMTFLQVAGLCCCCCCCCCCCHNLCIFLNICFNLYRLLSMKAVLYYTQLHS